MVLGCRNFLPLASLGVNPLENRLKKPCRAALKGDEPKGTSANLRFSAGSCGFLRFPAKICVSQMLCLPGKGENQRKSARISENLRLGSVCPLRSVLLSAPLTLGPRKNLARKEPRGLSRFSTMRALSSPHLCQP